MDALTGFIDFLLWLFGMYQEDVATQQQCAQMWEQGYVVYPLSEHELERAKQCADLIQSSHD